MTNNKYDNLCLYCFHPLDENGVCLHCKKAKLEGENPPNHLPRYTILNKKYLVGKSIGEGGFGITYLGYDIIKKTTIAIKEYFPAGYVSRDMRNNSIIINNRKNYSASNRGLKRFIDEAQNLNKLNDLEGIVKVLDFFSSNNTAYIIMEYLDGMSLKRYVSRKGKLTMNNTLAILKPVISSLEKVHEIGLIHRDISPDNIIITKSNQVKLIDFGASKINNMEDDHSISIVLKQGFAPEEQYRSHSQQGAFTDIYALGVTIYFCITGTLPPESLQRLYTDNLVPPSKLGADISYTQEQALLKCMAVFAKDRYQNIKDMMDELYFDFGYSQNDTIVTKYRTRSIERISHPSITIKKLIDQQNQQENIPSPPILNGPKEIHFKPRTTAVKRKTSSILSGVNQNNKTIHSVLPKTSLPKENITNPIKENEPTAPTIKVTTETKKKEKKNNKLLLLFRKIFSKKKN